jgi:hypothetical protein
MSGESALHVYAVNGRSDLRHTNLTRVQGDAPDLPPLADWLGVEGLDTDRIEIFPVADLGETRLSDYVTMAFDPAEPIEGETRARIDALDASVLLVPDAALHGTPAPGPEMTHIATLALAQPDHRADLPRAETPPAPPPRPEPAPAPAKPRRNIPQAAKFAIFIVIFILLYILLDG